MRTYDICLDNEIAPTIVAAQSRDLDMAYYRQQHGTQLSLGEVIGPDDYPTSLDRETPITLRHSRR